MRIAFDIDGVLREGSLGFFMHCTADPTPENLECLKVETMASMFPLVNPCLFATKDDEIYAISNCGSGHSVAQKRDWLAHFYGGRVTFIPVEVANGLWKKDYVDAVAKVKVEVMLRLGIEVYFDDDPMIVKVMRTLTDKIKFIKYGTWVEEYY